MQFVSCSGRKLLNEARRHSFTLCTYNILAKDSCRAEWFPHSEERHLDWTFRRQLFEQEFSAVLNADIICIQEMQESLFHEWLYPFMKRVGNYEGIMLRKERDQMVGPQLNITVPDDGCAVFVRQSRFAILEQENVDFTVHARTNRDKYHPEAHPLIDRAVHNVAICVRLQDLSIREPQSTTGESNNTFWLSTTHIYWDKKQMDVQLYQVETLLQHLKKLSLLHNNDPVIVCGDLNSGPSSVVYELLYKGFVDLYLHHVKDSIIFTKRISEHRKQQQQQKHQLLRNGSSFDIDDEQTAPEEKVFINPFGSDLHLAYECCETMKLPYTCHHGDWSDVIDHVAYSHKDFTVTRVLNPITEQDMTDKHKALPNSVHPSDHLPLMVEFMWRNH